MASYKDVNDNKISYANGALISSHTADDIKVFHYDLRGSTAAITDINGEITDRYQYSAYGEVSVDKGSKDATQFLYNGRDGVMTESNGLYYMRARYFSPALERFINADIVTGSIDNSNTLNYYAYVEGNPVSMIDPFGLCAEGVYSENEEQWWEEGNPFYQDSLRRKNSIGSSIKHKITNFTLGETGHRVCDVISFIPVISCIGDGLNSISYTNKEDYEQSALSAGGILFDMVGGKLIVKGTAKISSKIATRKAAKAASKAAAKYSDDIASAGIKNADDVVCKGKRMCFTAGTKIKAADGSKNIEDIKTGDYVYSRNVITGEEGYKKVLQVYEHKTSELVKVTIAGETIKTTAPHPFWVEGYGFKKPVSLK